MAFFRSFGRNWFEFGQEGQTFHLGEDSLSGYERNRLYRNDGERFTDIAWVSGVASERDGRGFVGADFDRDGDLDLVVVNDAQPLDYFVNRRAAPGHWLTVQLRQPTPNPSAVGALVRLTAGGVTQTRLIHAGSGYLSCPPAEAHFGLGDHTEIDALEVQWPDGTLQSVDPPDVDQLLTVIRETPR